MKQATDQDPRCPCEIDTGNRWADSEERDRRFRFPFKCRIHRQEWQDATLAYTLHGEPGHERVLLPRELDELRAEQERERSGYPFRSREERAKAVALCPEFATARSGSLRDEFAEGSRLLRAEGHILLPRPDAAVNVPWKAAATRLGKIAPALGFSSTTWQRFRDGVLPRRGPPTKQPWIFLSEERKRCGTRGVPEHALTEVEAAFTEAAGRARAAHVEAVLDARRAALVTSAAERIREAQRTK